jgi:uncharacterized protein YecE (DUF72 family)
VFPEACLPRASRSPAASQPSPLALFAGTSGWAYTSWKPDFYPKDVSARAFLAHYASRLNTVEVNYTFRKLPTPDQLTGWLDSVPAGFRFSFKAPQGITHMKRLRDSGAALTEFLDAIEPARRRQSLGLLLFQLPPNFKADNDRLAAFLALPTLRRKGVRVAFEFRHPSWFSEDTYAILRKRDAALCIAEGDDLRTPDVQTASFRCYRLRQSGGYSRAAVARFAKSISASGAPGDVFVHFRHEDEPTGPLSAEHLLKLVCGNAPKQVR